MPSNLIYVQAGLAFSLAQSQITTSYSTPTFTTFLVSDTTSSLQFNVNGPNSKILLGDQALRSTLPALPQTSNLNLASSMNSLNENKNFYSAKNRPFNIFLGSLLNENHYVDYRFANNLLTGQSFNANPHPAIQSLSSHSLNSLDHDTTSSYLSVVNYNASKGLIHTKHRNSSLVSDLFVGSREKTPRSLNTSY